MDYSIKTYTDSYPTAALLSIWKGNLEGIDSKRIEWFYNGNPQGKAVLLTAIDNKTGEEFGCLAAFPREAFYKGSPLRTAISGDFAVKSGWKTLLPALKLQKQLMSRPDFPVIIGFPNRQGYLVQKRAGFNDFAELTRFVKVFRSKDKLSKYLPDVICTLIAPIVDPLLKVCSKHWVAKLPKLVLKPLATSFGDLDFIWGKAKNQFDFILNRSARYLRWRFAEHPYKRYEVLIFYDMPTVEPCAYVIYRLVDKVIEVEDFLWVGDEKVLMSVIVQFQKYCFRLEASVICFQCYAFPFLRNIFKRMGYIARPGDKVVAHSSDKALLDIAAFHHVFLTTGDNDI